MIKSPRTFWLWALAAGQLAAWAGSEPELRDVFVGGQDRYPSIRIPSVVVSKQGTVLAFAEGRERPTDQGENDLVLKRSRDGGKTWGALQVVAEDGANSLNNPTAVVEQGSGRVYLMYQRIPAHVHEWSKEIAPGYEGTNVYRNLLVWSDDDGATWSTPLDVTRATKRSTLATTVASGPGIGIQLTRGPHRGRLLIPFNEGPPYQWNVYAVYSDDAGKTWQWGENAPGALVPDGKGGQHSQVNEVQMAELSDGAVRLNARQFAGAKVRKTAVSRDGGGTWSAIEDVPALRDPSCNASLLRYSFDDGQGKLLYSGPESGKRERGTIHLSADDGKTWPIKRLLVPGFFAYSVLTKLPDGTVGCLYESEANTRITFARVPLAWVEAGGFAKGKP